MNGPSTNESKEEQDEILYQGNVIPKVLKGVYALFTIFALSYVVKYLIPDLMVWLKK